MRQPTSVSGASRQTLPASTTLGPAAPLRVAIISTRLSMCMLRVLVSLSLSLSLSGSPSLYWLLLNSFCGPRRPHTTLHILSAAPASPAGPPGYPPIPYVPGVKRRVAVCGVIHTVMYPRLSAYAEATQCEAVHSVSRLASVSGDARSVRNSRGTNCAGCSLQR